MLHLSRSWIPVDPVPCFSTLLPSISLIILTWAGDWWEHLNQLQWVTNQHSWKGCPGSYPLPNTSYVCAGMSLMLPGFLSIVFCLFWFVFFVRMVVEIVSSVFSFFRHVEVSLHSLSFQHCLFLFIVEFQPLDLTCWGFNELTLKGLNTWFFFCLPHFGSSLWLDSSFPSQLYMNILSEQFTQQHPQEYCKYCSLMHMWYVQQTSSEWSWSKRELRDIPLTFSA